MVCDTRAFITTCPVCANGKSLHQLPAGLLNPLPIPRQPWSHIAVDFITGLPPSDGHTVIFTVVDRFSKTGHFVPLPKLPSAAATGDLLVQHVFQLYSISKDIVSDRGPQFTSQTERTNQSLESTLRCITAHHSVGLGLLLVVGGVLI